jgi:hypothetical protein
LSDEEINFKNIVFNICNFCAGFGNGRGKRACQYSPAPADYFSGAARSGSNT